jgi:hypothetical protein
MRSRDDVPPIWRVSNCRNIGVLVLIVRFDLHTYEGFADRVFAPLQLYFIYHLLYNNLIVEQNKAEAMVYPSRDFPIAGPVLASQMRMVLFQI